MGSVNFNCIQNLMLLKKKFSYYSFRNILIAVLGLSIKIKKYLILYISKTKTLLHMHITIFQPIEKLSGKSY